MEIEELLSNYLGIYYFVIFFVILVSFFLNQKKERRIYQTKVSKFYLIYLLVSTVVLMGWLAVKDVPPDSYRNMEFIKGIVLMLEQLAKYYQRITIFAFAIGFFLKGIYKVPNVNVQSIERKPNFLVKFFYNEDKSINAKGRLICKISQTIFVALAIVYLTIPIFSIFEIELLFSKVGLLLVITTFMELFYSLQGKEEIINKEKNNFWGRNDGLINVALKSLLRYSETEILNPKSIGNQEIRTDGPSALICEVPNIEELKEVNIKVMNEAFFENKKVLVICLNEKSSKKYHSLLNEFNKEYDGKLVIKLVTGDDKLFDESVDIFVTAIENCFGNIKLLSEIDSVIIEDYDEILLNKLELLRAFGSIVKMGNPDVSYIILTYMLQGIEATVKSLLYVKKISLFCPLIKEQQKEITINLWQKNDKLITEKLFGKSMKNLGSLVPLSLAGVKWNPNRILLISNHEPLAFELSELDTMRHLEDISFDNRELMILNSKAVTTTKERYFNSVNKNWVVIDDKNNVYEKIYKLSLLNGLKNNLNIVSEQYLLRDYMISMYYKNKTRLKSFLPYVPYEVNSGKIVLYNLLLQLTNFGVKETIIANILSENGIKITIRKGNNLRLIADKINEFIKQEFDLDVDIYSYITVKDVTEKYVFDMVKKKYIQEDKIYILDEHALKLFPNEIFSRVTFVKDGFDLDIEKEYAYNFYQKYLPGQKHFLNGYVYEIKNVIETEEGISAIVENSTNYDNNTYRQDRKVDILNDFVAKETRLNKYAKVTLRYQIGKIDYRVKTDGYFEFENGITKNPGEYRYVGLDSEVSMKTTRIHKKADAIKIEISRPNAVIESITKKVSDEISGEELGQKLAFLISEVLVSMLGENEKYVQVKAVKDAGMPISVGETWVSPIEKTNYISDNIEIYILEDTQIERGLIDMIYKNLDNIFGIINEYLEWVFDSKQNFDEERYKFLTEIERSATALKRYKLVYNIISNSII